MPTSGLLQDAPSTLEGRGCSHLELRHLLQDLRQSSVIHTSCKDQVDDTAVLASYPGTGMDSFSSLWGPLDRCRASGTGLCADAAGGDAAGGCERALLCGGALAEKAASQAMPDPLDALAKQRRCSAFGDVLDSPTLPRIPLSVPRPLVPMARPAGSPPPAFRFTSAEADLSSCALSMSKTVSLAMPSALDMSTLAADPGDVQMTAMELHECNRQLQERYYALEHAASAEICELRVRLQEAHARLADVHAERTIAAAQDINVVASSSKQDAAALDDFDVYALAAGKEEQKASQNVEVQCDFDLSSPQHRARCNDLMDRGIRRRLVPQYIFDQPVVNQDDCVRLRCFSNWRICVLTEKRREQAAALRHHWHLETGRDAELVGVLGEHYQVARRLTEQVVHQRACSHHRRLLTGAFGSWRCMSVHAAAAHRWQQHCVRSVLQTELVWHDRVCSLRCWRAWMGYMQFQRLNPRSCSRVASIMDLFYQRRDQENYFAWVFFKGWCWNSGRYRRGMPETQLHVLDAFLQRFQRAELVIMASFDAWHKISVERCRLMWTFERDKSEALHEWRCTHACKSLRAAYVRRLVLQSFGAIADWSRRLQNLRNKSACCHQFQSSLRTPLMIISNCWAAWMSLVREGMCERLKSCATAACVSLHVCRAAFSQCVRVQDELVTDTVARSCFHSWSQTHRAIKRCGRLCKFTQCNCLSVRVLLSWQGLALKRHAERAATRCARLRGQLLNVQQAAEAIQEFNHRITLAAALEVWWESVCESLHSKHRVCPASRPHDARSELLSSTRAGCEAKRRTEGASEELADKLDKMNDRIQQATNPWTQDVDAVALSSVICRSAVRGAAARLTPSHTPRSTSRVTGSFVSDTASAQASSATDSYHALHVTSVIRNESEVPPSETARMLVFDGPGLAPDNPTRAGFAKSFSCDAANVDH